MLQNMGSAGWAAFPAGTSLELKADGQKSGSQPPQGDMLDRADKQCDLLILGQTLTTDTGGMGSGGGSHALGQVHADVRSGIIEAAAKFTEATKVSNSSCSFSANSVYLNSYVTEATSHREKKL